jgi:hypothetical protein
MQLTLPFFRDAKRLLRFARSIFARKSVVVNRYERGGAMSLTIWKISASQYSGPYRTASPVRRRSISAPVVKAQRGNAVSKVLLEIAHELMPAEQPAAAGGWLARVFTAR